MRSAENEQGWPERDEKRSVQRLGKSGQRNKEPTTSNQDQEENLAGEESTGQTISSNHTCPPRGKMRRSGKMTVFHVSGVSLIGSRGRGSMEHFTDPL